MTWMTPLSAFASAVTTLAVFDPETGSNGGFNNRVRSILEHVPPPATYTASTKLASVTLVPSCASTVASAAGPHWYSVCGKNGTSASSTGGTDGTLARSTCAAQPPSRTASSVTSRFRSC